MNNPVKISSIIIAKNEERNIRRCIESQLRCIDNIVVLVDKSSADKTLDIVKNFEGIVWEEFEWMGYSASKQYALSKTKYDWVFWIDADEVLTSELIDELIERKQRGFDKDSYSVARRAYFLNRWIKHSGWYPGRVVRLFNKNKARFSEHDVHEHLVIDGNTGELKNDLEHYTDPNIFHYFEKFNKYTTLAANELGGKKRSVGVFDLIVRPGFLFFKMYILKRGFLDGFQGFILAVFSSLYVFTKYSKLWEINKNIK